MNEQFCLACGSNDFVECEPEDLAPSGSARDPDPGKPPDPDIPPAPSTAPRPRRLTVRFTAAGKTFQHDIAAGENVALGREPMISPFAAVFAADDLISRSHAVITYGTDGTVLIEDSQSTNGTYVNDEVLLRGSKRRLAEGDKIQLGEETTGYVRSAPAGPAEDTRHGHEETGPS